MKIFLFEKKIPIFHQIAVAGKLKRNSNRIGSKKANEGIEMKRRSGEPSSGGAALQTARQGGAVGAGGGGGGDFDGNSILIAWQSTPDDNKSISDDDDDDEAVIRPMGTRIQDSAQSIQKKVWE